MECFASTKTSYNIIKTILFGYRIDYETSKSKHCITKAGAHLTVYMYVIIYYCLRAGLKCLATFIDLGAISYGVNNKNLTDTLLERCLLNNLIH